jgi:acetyl-CoA synthetase
MIVQEEDLFAQYENLKSLRHSMSAGEPLNPEVIKVWKQHVGLDIYGSIHIIC